MDQSYGKATLADQCSGVTVHGGCATAPAKSKKEMKEICDGQKLPHQESHNLANFFLVTSAWHQTIKTSTRISL